MVDSCLILNLIQAAPSLLIKDELLLFVQQFGQFIKTVFEELYLAWVCHVLLFRILSLLLRALWDRCKLLVGGLQGKFVVFEFVYLELHVLQVCFFLHHQIIFLLDLLLLTEDLPFTDSCKLLRQHLPLHDAIFVDKIDHTHVRVKDGLE